MPARPRPLARPPVTAEAVHGITGLDGPDLPEPSIVPRERHMRSTSSSRR